MTNNPTANAHLLRHESILARLMEKATIPAPRIKEAMLYMLFPGGKRMRPLLVYLCGDVLNVSGATLDIIAVAMELIHCYSLVHDDLPAMDNDDLRRGKPSCHRAFDEATAILVGDGMQALAFDMLLTHLPQHLPLSQVLAVTHELVKACGASGMISGQSLDLSELNAPTPISESALCDIHLLKTGKLILACINMVLAVSQANPEEVQDLRQFATHLGLVFQMQDDYLDRYDSCNQLGKGRASDVANKKTTFATLQSKEALLDTIHTHFNHAERALARFGNQALPLQALVQSLFQRTAPLQPAHKTHN